MDEQKMISVEKMDEIIRDYYPETVTVDFHGQELIIRKCISFREMVVMVNRIVEASYNVDTGEFVPESREFMEDVLILAMYTNIRLPQSIEKQYRMIYLTDLMPIVFSNISDYQLQQIRYAVSIRIKIRNDRDTKAVEKQIQEATNVVTSVSNVLEEMFNGVDKDDITNVVKAIGASGIDMDKLVGAVIDRQAGMNNTIKSLHEVVPDGE